jgi:class 3 adenylate cyclase
VYPAPVSESPVRRLAAIMFTDMVGYTGPTERDEGRAVRARDRHRAMLQPLVEQFEGELVETPGDRVPGRGPPVRLET